MNHSVSEEQKQIRLARFLRLVHTRAILDVMAGSLDSTQAWKAVSGAENIQARSLPLDELGAAERWVEVAGHDFKVDWTEDWIHAALKGREYKEPYTR